MRWSISNRKLGFIEGRGVELLNEKVALAVFSGILGFALSQLFNLIEFLRRPRFRVRSFGHGVVSSYTGDPPEAPWEIDLGFYLENHGKRAAKNTRVFVSTLSVSEGGNSPFEETSLEFRELKSPVDLIPSGEAVLLKFGKITGETHSLKLNLKHETNLNLDLDFSESDTREKRAFSGKFFVTCEDKNSIDILALEFRPDRADWAGQMIAEYDVYSIPTGPAV
jgi:hypothetical protein